MTENVLYSQALIQSLEESLASAFSLPHLRLNRRPQNPGGIFHISLQTVQRTIHLDDGSEQGIAEILTSSKIATGFYFGFVADFTLSSTRKHTLQHASLSVFQDIIGELTPLFRAEWDHLDAGSASNHAQPHWHFVQTPQKIENIVRKLTGSSGDTMEFGAEKESEIFSGLADCGKIHFAMTSLWSGNGSAPKILFDSDNFPRWFFNLSNYIAGQIDYLISRTSPAITTFNS